MHIILKKCFQICSKPLPNGYVTNISDLTMSKNDRLEFFSMFLGVMKLLTPTISFQLARSRPTKVEKQQQEEAIVSESTLVLSVLLCNSPEF